MLKNEDGYEGVQEIPKFNIRSNQIVQLINEMIVKELFRYKIMDPSFMYIKSTYTRGK